MQRKNGNGLAEVWWPKKKNSNNKIKMNAREIYVVTGSSGATLPLHTYKHIYILCVYCSYQYSLSTRENTKLGWERYGLEPMRNLRAATDWCERLVNRNNRLSAACHVLLGNLCRRICSEKNCTHNNNYCPVVRRLPRSFQFGWTHFADTLRLFVDAVESKIETRYSRPNYVVMWKTIASVYQLSCLFSACIFIIHNIQDT